MTKNEFRDAVRALLSQEVGVLSFDEKAALVNQCLIDVQEAAPFDESCTPGSEFCGAPESGEAIPN